MTSTALVAALLARHKCGWSVLDQRAWSFRGISPVPCKRWQPVVTQCTEPALCVTADISYASVGKAVLDKWPANAGGWSPTPWLLPTMGAMVVDTHMHTAAPTYCSGRVWYDDGSERVAIVGYVFAVIAALVRPNVGLQELVAIRPRKPKLQLPSVAAAADAHCGAGNQVCEYAGLRRAAGGRATGARGTSLGRPTTDRWVFGMSQGKSEVATAAYSKYKEHKKQKQQRENRQQRERLLSDTQDTARANKKMLQIDPEALD